jgi:hypothetical protein
LRRGTSASKWGNCHSLIGIDHYLKASQKVENLFSKPDRFQLN